MADGEKSKLAPLWHDVKASAKDAAMVIPRALASLLENPALTIIIMKTLVGLLLTGTIGAVVVEMAVKPGGHLAYVMLHDVLGFIDKLWSALSPIIDAVSDLINIVGGWLIGGFHVDLPDKLHLGDALDMFKDEGRMCNEFKSVEAEVGSNPKMVGRDKRCRVFFIPRLFLTTHLCKYIRFFYGTWMYNVMEVLIGWGSFDPAPPPHGGNCEFAHVIEDIVCFILESFSYLMIGFLVPLMIVSLFIPSLIRLAIDLLMDALDIVQLIVRELLVIVRPLVYWAFRNRTKADLVDRAKRVQILLDEFDSL